MPPPPVEAPEIEFERKTQLSRLTDPAPVERPAPPAPNGTELDTNVQPRNRGEPFSTRAPAPRNDAKFAVKVTPEISAEPPLTQIPAPRSWLLAGLPSAWPPETVKPSSLPVFVTVASLVTTW